MLMREGGRARNAARGKKEHNGSVSLSADDLASVRGAIAGEALLADDPGWDAARQPWNLLAEQRPAVVGIPASAGDVAALVGFAGARGLRVAPQGTGHGSASLRALDGAMLLRTTRLNDVEIDVDARRARAGAGCMWGDVVAAAAPHGLVALHGSSGTVGVAGYTLTGGLGWLARSRGFACNSVTALEVVTAAGERAEVTAAGDPELFWALRGGGGGSGIVTALEFELFELREVYAGSLMWPIELAQTIAQAWREWTKTVPEELTSTLKLARFPPFP
jgi:FAD/FMN-containing dehydrogenase